MRQASALTHERGHASPQIVNSEHTPSCGGHFLHVVGDSGGKTESFEDRCKGESSVFERRRLKVASENIGDRLEGTSESSDGDLEGHSVSFLGGLRGSSLNVALSTVSALFADDRLPLRYLESLLRRLRSGREPSQAALLFDGYGLGWSWKLDSEVLSSLWLPSTDLNSLTLPEDSVPTDDWSMQPPTAGDWSAIDPPTASDWSTRQHAGRDWSLHLPPTSDMYHIAHNCSLLPSLHYPLSDLFSTNADSDPEFPDQSLNLVDGRERFENPGGIFCDCCGVGSGHRLSSTDSPDVSLDHPETVDFFIDDGADAVSGCCAPLHGEVVSRSGKSRPSDDKDSDSLATNVWNDLLQALGDIAETLV